MPSLRGAARCSIVLPAVVGSLLLAACGAAAGPGANEPIKVAVLRQPHLFHPYFYERFLPNGRRVQMVPFSDSTEIKNAVNTGSADFGVTGITSALQGAAAGESFRVLASAADGGSAIVAGGQSGIASVGALRGKRIGYVPGSAQDILLRLTLRRAAIDPENQVELINVGFSDMVDALRGGSIDAFSGAEIGPSNAISSGARLVTRPYGTPMGKINIVLGTSQDLIDDQPGLVREVVAAHVKAVDYMRSNKREWADASADAYGFEPGVVGAAIDNIEPRSTIDARYIDQARVLGDQLRAEEQMRGTPDYDEFIDESFVRQATGGSR